MIIEKDVEKMYRSDMEKQKKNQKKKKKKKLFTGIIIIVIIVAVLLLMKYLGIGFGGGKGDGGEESSANASVSSAADETTTTTTTTAAPKEYISIKVSGSTYIYNGVETSVEDFIGNVKLMNDNVVVSITDDNATQNAMDALTKALETEEREYLIEQPADDSSELVSDSSEDASYGSTENYGF